MNGGTKLPEAFMQTTIVIRDPLSAEVSAATCRLPLWRMLCGIFFGLL